MPTECQTVLGNAYKSDATNFEALLVSVLIKLSDGMSMRYQRLDSAHVGYNSDDNNDDLVSAIFRVQLFDTVSYSTRVTHPSNRKSFFGVSLYTLLNLGVLPSIRSKLIRLLVDLPVHSSVPLTGDSSTVSADLIAPWNLFLRMYRSLDSQLSTSSDTSIKPAYFSLWYHPDSDSLSNSKEFARKFAMRSSQERKKRRKAYSTRDSKRDFSRRLENDYLHKARTLGSKIGVTFDGASSSAADRVRAKLLWVEISKELTSHPADLTGGRSVIVIV